MKSIQREPIMEPIVVVIENENDFLNWLDTALVDLESSYEQRDEEQMQVV